MEQLDEVESYVQLEDVLRLAKRLARNTRNLEQMLDQMESLAELGRDFSPLTQDAFLTMMNRLDEMERKGYFAFMRGGMEIMDNVVTSFTEEDVRQLGENVVLILQTVKEMTQPDMMKMMRSTASYIREEEPVENVSMMSILRQLNDPAVKRGLAKTLIGFENRFRKLIQIVVAGLQNLSSLPNKKRIKKCQKEKLQAKQFNLMKMDLWPIRLSGTKALPKHWRQKSGLRRLTDRHWTVIEFCRTDFEAQGDAPTLRRITKVGGVPTKELYQLFPKGPAKKVAYVAGLKKPSGCI